MKASTTRPLTAERLREVLRYNRTTGAFSWRVTSSRRISIGDRAGTITTNGYRVIQIDGWHYKAARLAWLYCFGRWPEATVDHRNLKKSDDRISNLRNASDAQNNANVGILRSNRSGFKGVSAARGRWKAQIRSNGVRIYLGQFATPEEAAAAYQSAAKRHHGEFARF